MVPCDDLDGSTAISFLSVSQTHRSSGHKPILFDNLFYALFFEKKTGLELLKLNLAIESGMSQPKLVLLSVPTSQNL